MLWIFDKTAIWSCFGRLWLECFVFWSVIFVLNRCLALCFLFKIINCGLDGNIFVTLNTLDMLVS